MPVFARLARVERPFLNVGRLYTAELFEHLYTCLFGAFFKTCHLSLVAKLRCKFP